MRDRLRSGAGSGDCSAHKADEKFIQRPSTTKSCLVGWWDTEVHSVMRKWRYWAICGTYFLQRKFPVHIY